VEIAKSPINGTHNFINHPAWIAVKCAEKARKTVDDLCLITTFGEKMERLPE
jgi:hypothetical protein